MLKPSVHIKQQRACPIYFLCGMQRAAYVEMSLLRQHDGKTRRTKTILTPSHVLTVLKKTFQLLS